MFKAVTKLMSNETKAGPEVDGEPKAKMSKFDHFFMKCKKPIEEKISLLSALSVLKFHHFINSYTIEEFFQKRLIQFAKQLMELLPCIITMLNLT